MLLCTLNPVWLFAERREILDQFCFWCDRYKIDPIQGEEFDSPPIRMKATLFHACRDASYDRTRQSSRKGEGEI